MNKIRLIFAAVLCFVTMTAVAQAPTYSSVNNNKTTERNNAKWYTIKNVKTGEYLRYEGFKFSMTTSPKTVDGVYALDTCAMFYVTGNADAAYIHNYAAGTQRVCVAPNKWDETGTAFQIKTTTGGVFISQSGNTAASDAFHYNESTGKVDLYLGSDPGSVWYFEPIEDFADIMGLNKLVDEAYEAVNSSDIWGGGFWSGLGKLYETWRDKATLKDGYEGIFWGIGAITPITEKSHSTLAATMDDINTAQEILNKYSEGYQTIFKYAELYNEDFSDGENKRWLSTNSTSLTINGIQTTHTNVWYIQHIEGEMFYIYNEAANMYVGMPYETDDGMGVNMSSDVSKAGVYRIVTTKDDVELGNNNTTLISAIVRFESIDIPGMYICLPDATSKDVKCASSEDTPGVRWKVLPAADVEITDKFYGLAANMAWQYPHYLQLNEGLVKEPCEKYSTNADVEDGTSTCLLTDGSYVTSLTTVEGSTGENHYLQADLDGKAVTSFYFYIKANLQTTSGRPVKIRVSGSNDGTSFTDITTVETNMRDEMFYFSDLINCPSYTHLRFTIEGVNVGDKAFTMSEFYILPHNNDVDACVATIKGFYGTALYEDKIKVYASELIALESQYYLDNNTVDNGKVAANGATPQPGQYRYDKRTALQNALTVFKQQTTDDAKYEKGKLMAAALEEFKNSKCSPMFVISSAWEDGYSSDWAIKCNETNKSFTGVEINEWDARQWFTNYKLESTVIEPVNATEMKSAIGNILLMNAQHSSIEGIEEWNELYESGRDAYSIRLYNGNDYLMVDEYMDLGVVSSPATTEGNKNAAWYFTYVGTSAQIYGLDATNSDHMAVVDALAKFGELYTIAKNYNDNYDATATQLGKYHYDNKGANSLTKEGFDNLFAIATTHYNKGAAKILEEYLSGTSDYTPEVITSFVDALEQHFVNFHLNTPPAGYYYRIRGRVSLNYLQSGINGGTLTMGAITDAHGNINDAVAATSVFYAVDGNADGATNILSFNTGRYIQAVTEGGKVVFKEDDLPLDNEAYYSQDVLIHPSRTDSDGYYAWAFDGSNYLCDNITNATTAKNVEISAGNSANKKYDWTIELVTELPVEISSAKMTSLCVPVELEIPDGVTAYILTGKEIADGNHLYAIDYETYTPGTEVFNVEQIGCGIIPAGMPVLIKAEAGVHYFPINYNATDADKDDTMLEEIAELKARNRLEGTHDSRLISERAGIQHHILSKKNGKVGMFKVKMVSAAERGLGYVTKPTFINQAHRAWLPYSAAMSASGFSFAVGGKGHDTTGIDEVGVEREEHEAIYDLQGRRLEGITSPGFYIVNGKKIIVK